MFSVLSLLRGASLSARLLRGAAVTILLCRGLLSGAVMFDMHAPVGSFGLVMCSGFGPLFPSVDATQNDDAMTHPAAMAGHDGGTGMAMGMSMVGALSDDAATSDAPAAMALSPDSGLPAPMSGDMPMHATADANDICAFSAALLLGVAALFVVLLLLRALPTVRRLRTRLARVRHNAASPFALPLSRAPPFAAIPA